MARTDTLGHFLTDVANAIRTKKGTSDTIQASDFDTAIENLPSGGNVSEYIGDTIVESNNSAPGTGLWSYLVTKLPPIKISSSITNMNNWFQNYQGTAITFDENVNTSNVTRMSNLFYHCDNITAIDLSRFNTSKLQYANNMFESANSLTNINFGNFDTSKVTSFSRFFLSCSELTTLDLSSFTSTAATSISQMFYGCNKLTHLDMRAFDFTKYTTSSSYSYTFVDVPTTCEIIVTDQTQKDWFATNFSTLTNVKTVAEYEAEQNQ